MQSYKADVIPTLKKSYRRFKLTALLARSWIHLTTVFLQFHSNGGTFLSILLVEQNSFSSYIQDVTPQEGTLLLLSSSSYWLLASQIFYSTAIIPMVLLHTMSKPHSTTWGLLSKFINRLFSTSAFSNCSDEKGSEYHRNLKS